MTSAGAFRAREELPPSPYKSATARVACSRTRLSGDPARRRLLAGRPPHPDSSAGFLCDEPAYSAECRVLFCADARFNQPVTRITFDASYLDLPVIQTERSMKEFLRGAPANFLVKYRNSDSLTAKIRRRLRQVPPADWPDFETLAKQLHTTPRPCGAGSTKRANLTSRSKTNSGATSQSTT